MFKNFRMIQRLKKKYLEKVIVNLREEFGYNNPHQLPKIEKIHINRGLGLSASNNTVLKKSIQELTAITGQKPIITKSKKSISGFKIRKTMELGITVTLRKERMYAFLDKLIHLTLPQIRDFRGISSKQFDKHGNFNLGIKEQFLFPEINYEDTDQMRGFDICIVTTAKTKAESTALLKALGFPFTN